MNYESLNLKPWKIVVNLCLQQHYFLSSMVFNVSWNIARERERKTNCAIIIVISEATRARGIIVLVKSN